MRNDEKPIAVKCESNFGGIEILEIYSESVVSAFNYGERRDIKRTKLYSTGKRSYFRRYGTRYNIDEFLRV